MTPTEARHRLLALRERAMGPMKSVPVLRELRCAGDIVEMLSEELNAVRCAPEIDASERARLIGGLSSLALKAIEQMEGDQRVKAIERVLKLRRDEAHESQKNRRN